MRIDLHSSRFNSFVLFSLIIVLLLFLTVPLEPNWVRGSTIATIVGLSLLWLLSRLERATEYPFAAALATVIIAGILLGGVMSWFFDNLIVAPSAVC